MNRLLAALLILNGCAYMHSTTLRKEDPKTGLITETTTARAYSLFDSKAELTKFVNRSGYTSRTNNWAPGTYIGNLNENASSTNLSNVIEALARGVVSGLK